MWLKLASCLTRFGVIAYADKITALTQQITADATLPLSQRTQVTNNNSNFQIDGRATQGTNLFYSCSTGNLTPHGTIKISAGSIGTTI